MGPDPQVSYSLSKVAPQIFNGKSLFLGDFPEIILQTAEER